MQLVRYFSSDNPLLFTGEVNESENFIEIMNLCIHPILKGMILPALPLSSECEMAHNAALTLLKIYTQQ